MILQDLIRDITSYLNLDSDQPAKITINDILYALNDSGNKVRLEYIKNGIRYPFSTTETLYTTINDVEFPFLKYFELSQSVLKSINPSNAIINSVVYTASQDIRNLAQTFAIGDIAYKGDYLYEAVSTITNINTYTKTFDNYIRNYTLEDGLIYNVDDIILYEDAYYKCLIGYTNTYTDTPDTLDIALNPAWEQVYWKLIGPAYFYAFFVPFSEIFTIKNSDELDNSFVFTFKSDKIYVPEKVKKFIITYIPDGDIFVIDDLENELDYPNDFLTDVKVEALNYLQAKFGKPIVVKIKEDK